MYNIVSINSQAKEEAMKAFQVSDELYDQLKDFVVDPFDDTPEIVISRLVDIVNKAKSRWSPLDAVQNNDESQSDYPPSIDINQPEEERVVAL